MTELPGLETMTDEDEIRRIGRRQLVAYQALAAVGRVGAHHAFDEDYEEEVESIASQAAGEVAAICEARLHATGWEPRAGDLTEEDVAKLDDLCTTFTGLLRLGVDVFDADVQQKLAELLLDHIH